MNINLVSNDLSKSISSSFALNSTAIDCVEKFEDNYLFDETFLIPKLEQNSIQSVNSTKTNKILDKDERTKDVSNKIVSDLIDLLKKKNTAFSRRSISPKIFNENKTIILKQSEPVPIDETEEIEVLGHRGIWINKSESLNWKGVIPLNEYSINQDTNPQIITKKLREKLEYVQELAIRYLRPPTPATPGEILIQQEPNVLTSPAPPLIIRQQPPRPQTPKPLVIREAPPTSPQRIGRKLITISGKNIPPPPRKVIIEKLAQLPAKPQSILIERWLPYSKVKRKVIFKAAPPVPIIAKPRNTIIKWKAPEIQIKKEYTFLGVVRANPSEYINKFGKSLKLPVDLPDLVNDIKQPDNIMLAANYKPLEYHELEGDLHALKLVNLEKEGLEAYKNYLVC